MDHPEDRREVAACLDSKYWPGATDVNFLTPGWQGRSSIIMNNLLTEMPTHEPIQEEGVETLLGNVDETVERENDASNLFDNEAREARHCSDDDENSCKALKQGYGGF